MLVQWISVESVCINEVNNIWFAETINSVFGWRRRATTCYVWCVAVFLFSTGADQITMSSSLLAEVPFEVSLSASIL